MAGFSSGTARTFFSYISQFNISQTLKNANTREASKAKNINEQQRMSNILDRKTKA
jgi:hypothetical protein